MKKKMRRRVWMHAAFAALAVAMIPAVGVERAMAEGSTAPQSSVNVFDSRIFNWRFYFHAYPDLIRAQMNAGKSDSSENSASAWESFAKWHWQNHGIAEGRQAHPLFHSRQYLDQYSDLRAAFGATNYQGALTHYLTFGVNEGRSGYVKSGAYGRWTIYKNGISVSTSLLRGGAVDSVIWQGREFVNNYDHGRQLQTALSIHPYGEAYNPTEAGSGDDGHADYTSSQLEGINTAGETLRTQSLPAFWRYPAGVKNYWGTVRNAYRLNEPASSPNNREASLNTTVVSAYRLNKQIDIGVAGLPNVLHYNMSFAIPENHRPENGAVLEFATGYMPEEFSRFYWYSPASDLLENVPETFSNFDFNNPKNQETNKPVIAALPDGSAAMGCWSPSLPQSDFPAYGYGVFRFLQLSNATDRCVKWNMVARTGPLQAGQTLGRDGYIIIGDLNTVKTTMRQLYLKHLAGQL